MNKDIYNNINRFINDVSLAGEKLKFFSQRIDQKDKMLRDIVGEFNKFLNEMSIDEKENEFIIELQNTLTQYKTKSNKWLGAINSYIDGKEFINQFEKSILFVVFGNVNVGKSSIGNFIAGSKKELGSYYTQEPIFYMYDVGNESEKNKPVQLVERAFKENFTEETTTIQYYTLCDGLTWVDSPGIHSINGENEELAKKYVDYADLVLFVMSSSSPGKYDEFLEISRLINKKKPLLVIMNKSDIIEQDEVDGKLVTNLVAKSHSDRMKQEQYVKTLFEQNTSIHYIQSLESISLSIHLAQKALNENNYHLFIDSGLPRFYEKLGNMLKENALGLKQMGPRQRINSLINEILNGFISKDIKVEGILGMQESFEIINKKIDENIEKIHQIEKRLLKDVCVMTMPDIDLAVSKLSAKLQNGETTDDLNKVIERIIIDNLNGTIRKYISNLLSDFEHDNISALNLHLSTNLEGKYETFTYTEYSAKEVSRAPDGFFEHIGELFGKKYTTIKTQSRQIEKKMLVGDNSSEIIQMIISNLGNELQPIVSNVLNNVANNYFGKEKKIVSNIIRKLKETENMLTKEIM